ALGGVYLLNPTDRNTIQPVSETTVQKVNNNTTAALPDDIIPGSFSASAKKAMPAVVHISSTFESRGGFDDGNPFRFFFGEEGGRNPMRPRQGSGSGVIYSSDGYIMTNNHVIENASEVQVTLYDNRKLRARVIGTNPKTDLAVLKIEGNDLPTLEIADSDAAEIGDWVLAVGNPFELRSTVTAGIISAKGRSIGLLGRGDAIESFIQTDAAVNPGNSGGALVDQNGALLGINTAIATERGVFSGYSFAIPINLATRIVDDIIEYGSYQRPFLGVSIFDLDNEIADSLNVDVTQGVVIQDVQVGGSAAYAGIQRFDVVVKVDDKNIRNVPELQEAIGSSKVGETITLTVLRNQRRKNIDIRLKAKPDSGN
ncbi:MAG: trypsin-like peptidase domain-containing protein, partial [Bacteroidota bacterium]